VQTELMITACVDGHYVIQNPLYKTKFWVQPVQLIKEKHEEQLMGHKLHWPDCIKYLGGH
jgi:hypothetical protein